MSVVDVIVGAAFGSEGKGHITAQVVERYLYTGGLDVLNIRVAGPNAGHTVIDSEGNSFALRQIPVGAAIDDLVALYIAPGSEIDMPVLLDEIANLRAHGHKVDRLYVSGEATLIDDEHKEDEARNTLNARVGSTAKGIGAARASRLWRLADRLIDRPDEVTKLTELGAIVLTAAADLSFIEDWVYGGGNALVIEGTQGYGLGLHSGYYPFATSSDCRAIDFLAMAGISPWHQRINRVSVWLAARVFPIRVAGNSGPLEGETSWEELGLPEEFTTVTKKTRRVGKWDSDLVRRAVIANGGGAQVNTINVQVMIALTMADQMFPQLAGLDNEKLASESRDRSGDAAVTAFIRQIEDECGARIGVIGTGPRTVIWKA